MSAKRTRMRLGEGLKESRTDWARLDRLSDADIAKAVRDDSDSFEMSARWIRKMGRLVVPNPKERLTVRFDADVVDWFRRQGRGYQTRMNEVLRTYYEHARKSKRRA